MIYEAICTGCRAYSTFVSSVADRDKPRTCPGCGAWLERAILTPPTAFVAGRFEAFRSTVDGTLVDSQRALREHNARNNVVCLSDGYDEAAQHAGDFGQKPPLLDKTELVADLQESIFQLEQGYKPSTGADNG